MSRMIGKNSLQLTLAALALAAVMVPGLAQAQQHDSTVASQIKSMIMADNQATRTQMVDQKGTISKDGSLEFWSSGGLLQSVAPDAPLTAYEQFSLTPKQIEVIELPGGEAAVAMYYSEGSMKEKGGRSVDHYLTRVMQVYVKENGKWVTRAAHYSPITGGAGTGQSSVD